MSISIAPFLHYLLKTEDSKMDMECMYTLYIYQLYAKHLFALLLALHQNILIETRKPS